MITYQGLVMKCEMKITMDRNHSIGKNYNVRRKIAYHFNMAAKLKWLDLIVLQVIVCDQKVERYE